MTTPRSVLLLADPRPPKRVLAGAVERLHRAGARVLLVTYQPLPAGYAEVDADEAHALGPAAQAHGPEFRRQLRRAGTAERLALHVQHDDRFGDRLHGPMLVVALGDDSALAARRLAKRHPGAQAVVGVNKAIRSLGRSDERPAAARRSRSVGLGDVVDRLPVGAVTGLLGTPLLSRSRREAVARRTGRRLLASGLSSTAADVVSASLRRGTAPRVRADLLGDVVSWSLAHGEQPGLAREAYAAELAVADRAYAARRYRVAGESFAEAARTAFHRVLHFDHQTSPLAADPAGFTAPLAQSTTAEAVRAPRGRDRTLVNDSTGSTNGIASTSRTIAGTRPTRLLLATRKNADFLGDIREHFAAAPDVDTRFVDFASTSDDLERFVKDPALIVEQVLAGRRRLTAAAEACFRPHLEWADVIFVEWCTALAAVLTQVDPRDTRVVVRMHSYEAFTVWPHLMDFSRVDDMVFVSNHLRDLAVAAIPGLRGPDAPRLHVITNAMDLRRFDRPKPDAARFTLGLVGASKMVKDPRWAIEVLRHLRKHDERYRLLLIRGRLQDPSAATRSYVEALQADLAELEPSGAVRVLAHTDDVPGVLEDVGVVLSTSVRESFHMGLVEGAASGAVPVVRDWPFFPGAARDLFPPDWVVDTPEDAAIRILAATSTGEAWRSTGRAAAEHVSRRWDWQVVKHDFDRLLSPEA